MSQASSTSHIEASQFKTQKYKVFIETALANHGIIALFCLGPLTNIAFEVMTARVFTHGLFKGCLLSRILDGPLVFGAIDVEQEQAREWIMQRLLNSEM